MGTQWVSLLPSSKQVFRRAIRDGDGNVTDVLRFEPDVPLKVDDKGCEVILNDIGRTLCLVDPADDHDPPKRFEVDWDGTNAIHQKLYGTKVPRQAASIQSGAGQRPPVVSDAGEGGSDEGDDDDEIVLDDDLADLLAKHESDLPSPLTPESLAEWIGSGNSLTTLDGFEIDSAARLHQAMGLEPPAAPTEENQNTKDNDPGDTPGNETPASDDPSKLVAAGLSEDLVNALAKNAGEHPWVMDPEQIKAKLAEGFDLTTLTDIGNGRAKNIRTALGIEG